MSESIYDDTPHMRELRAKLAMDHEAELANDEAEAKRTDDGWIKLPVDADGVPIHLGDELEIERGGATDIGDVTDIHLQEGKCAVSICFEYDSFVTAYPEDYKHHVKPRTIEEILREFAGRVLKSGHQWGLDAEATTAECAAEIRELVGVERLCYVETVPMGAHADDGDAEVCSNCRVPIDDDVYYCSNCGARIVDKRELMRGDAE